MQTGDVHSIAAPVDRDTTQRIGIVAAARSGESGRIGQPSLSAVSTVRA